MFQPRRSRLLRHCTVAGLLLLAACSASGGTGVSHDRASERPSPGLSVPDTVAGDSLTLIGADGRGIVLTAEDIAALPRESFSFSRHEDNSVFEGPLLLDVLGLAGVPSSPLHKDQQATALLITAADGYQVVLGLGETDPATRADRIILADTDDGTPLSDGDGPFMVVAEGDARAARSPRMVVSIQIIPLGNVGTQGT